jgi:hypothetical protein
MMTKTFNVCSVLALLTFTSCAHTYYFVATETTFEQLRKEEEHKKIIYLTSEFDTLPKIDLMARLINKKKWIELSQVARYLSSDRQRFLTSIKHMIEKDYAASYRLLSSLDENSYDCQVKLLKIDCLYELRVDSVKFRSAYQNALNCTQSEVIKSVINTHYRFSRYGK